MDKCCKIGFVGSGNMASAIANGLLEKQLYSPEEIIASNRSKDRLKAFKERFGVLIAENNQELVQKAQTIIIAVKPQQFLSVAKELKPFLDKNQLVISIMAGVSIATISQALGEHSIVRAMPNTPAQIGFGMTAICYDGLNEEQISLTKGIFNAIGEHIIIDESQIDAASALSGCGPAYMYQIIEAIADGGVMVGLPRALAYQLAAQTMVGAGEMVLKTKEHPAILKDNVTSPAGSTIRAINIMEQNGVRGALMAAVEAAYLKNKQLGEIK